MPAKHHVCFASVAPGLEDVLAEELEDLGARGAVEPGGVRFRATPRILCDIHLWARVPSRVTVEVCRAGNASLQSIGHAVRSAGWKRFVHAGQPLSVKATSGGGHGRQGAVEKKVERAIRDALRGPRRSGPRPPREPVQVLVHVTKQGARVSVDATGDLLHRRGWRKETARAPIRENLGAALLRLADWDPDEPLVDPMCGSGTLPIEAATIAAGIAAGSQRTFAFERWPSFDAAIAKAARREASELGPVGRPLVFASDRDPGAVKATTQNAKRAGVGGALQVEHARFEELEPPAPTGLLVANPPYGGRIGSGAFGWIAKALRERWGGWRVAMVLPASGKRVLIPLGLNEVATFKNGGIPVSVVTGTVRSDSL